MRARSRLDLAYRAPRPVELPIIAEALGDSRPRGERMRFIIQKADEGDRARSWSRRPTVPAMAYSARRIPEIADDIASFDDAIRWGFARQMGPSRPGRRSRATVERMERQGIEVAGWVKEMLAVGTSPSAGRGHGCCLPSG
ncbi:MAG: hypothetical protein U0232_27385 [Thermomicrobiales bacterium]